MKIKGTFKDYDNLLLAYNITDDKNLDDSWRSYLKKVAGRDVVLTNYTALNKTFDAAYLMDDPNQPGQLRITFPDGIESRYANNLPTRVLDTITCDDCDRTIFCTKCGLQIEKDVGYDLEPRFSWEDIFEGNCEKENSENIDITFNVCKDDLIFCPKCRTHTKFEEVGTTI
jgi:hypothetical protein